MSKKLHASPRARRWLKAVLILAIVAFVSFMIHLLWVGTSAFPGGRVEGGRYLVESHGKTYEFTPLHYWLSYAHGVVMVFSMALYFGTVLYFYQSGDLREEVSE